jgi:hydrogenase maturation factor HypF (carbamoyltransferase family)
MAVVWRRQAEQDLQRIFDFILEHNPAAAQRVAERIERRVAELQAIRGLAGAAGSPGRVSWSSPARRTSWPIGSRAGGSTFLLSCMERADGRRASTS